MINLENVDDALGLKVFVVANKKSIAPNLQNLTIGRCFGGTQPSNLRVIAVGKKRSAFKELNTSRFTADSGGGGGLIGPSNIGEFMPLREL